MNQKLLSIGVFSALALSSPGAIINTNVAPSGAIIYASAQYNADFNAGRVIDGKTDELQTSATSYWLAPDGAATASFILDLRRDYPVKSIDLFNTHNRQYNDRGTGDFEIYASDDVRPKYPGGNVDRYYPLNGDVTDQSGNGIDAAVWDSPLGNVIDGTYSDDIPSVLKTGQSISFSGAGEHIEIPDAPGMSQPAAYTISLWVKFTDPLQPANIITRTASPGNENNTWSHQLRLYGDANGNYYFQNYLYDAGANAADAVTGTTLVQPDVWYHVVGTAENGGKEHLYVNGVEEGAPLNVTTIWTGGTLWEVGTGSGGGFAPGVESVDDLAIWFTALPPALVARLVSGEKPATVVNSSASPIGLELVNPKLILSGTLSDVSGEDQIVADSFTSANGFTPTTTRYLEFRALNAKNGTGSANVGLNEIQVNADVDTTPPAVEIDKAVLLSWPYNPFGYSLESSPNLSPGNWSPVPGTPTVVSTNLQLFLPVSQGTVFYRLTTP